jgi:murein DD-endopeptidase MepM/ murein hydrolase activator NlpD
LSSEVWRRTGFAALLLAGAGNVSAVAAPALQQSFDIQVPVPPTPVIVSGSPRLVFELHVTNFAREPLRLQRLTILDPKLRRTVAEFRDDTLVQRLAQPAAASATKDPLTIAPGARVVVYLELDLARGRAAPATLAPRVEYSRSGTTEAVEGTDVPVRRAAPPVLSAPLRGGPWAAVYHPSWERGHRRVLYAVGGRARIPGRFAIDWIKLDAKGRQTRDGHDRVADWLGYGADVLAVADAVVAATRDDVTESAHLSTHPNHTLEDATGNYVALDLGDGRYAFYEHLKPGSVRVAPSQRVRRGQVIAALGFTGQSTGPHLHFHVADANSPLGAEGVPFVLERFELLGAYPDIGSLGKAPWVPLDGSAGSTRIREMPAPNVVVRFDASGFNPTDSSRMRWCPGSVRTGSPEDSYSCESRRSRCR